MPSICDFYGIEIYMYFEVHNKHHLPHLHAKYQNDEAEFDFDGNVIQGSIPDKQRKLVVQWIQENKEQISVEWGKLQDGKKPDKIAPLK